MTVTRTLYVRTCPLGTNVAVNQVSKAMGRIVKVGWNEVQAGCGRRVK